MRAMRPTQIVVAALAALVIASPALGADFKLFDMDVAGEFEAGVRAYIDRPAPSRRGKFEEYRDLPGGPFLERFRLTLFSTTSPYSTEFEGSKWGQEDQEFALSTGRLGLWQFGFEWDQTPHVFSTTARFLATETRRGVFQLPDANQAAAAAAIALPRTTPAQIAASNAAQAAALSVHNTPSEREISVRWDTARLFLNLTPTPDWDVRTQYMRIAKEGERPFSLVFGTPGSHFYEVPEPIEHTVQDFRLRGTLMRERWQLQAGYTFSMFQNSVQSVVADNPLSAVNGAFVPSSGALGQSTPAVGRISLPPDNMAHTFNIAGAMSLPMRTRLSANVAYSLRMQNDPFLPHTINPVLIANDATGVLALPRRSLDGVIGTTTLNLNATTRPLGPLTITAKYRLFDHQNMSEEPRFEGNVENDLVLRAAERLAQGFEYTRHNADLDARWQLFRAAAITVGGGWERWDRNKHREVPKSDEFTGKLALDVTPADWVAVRLAYRPSLRRISEYNTFAHLAHTVTDEELGTDVLVSQSTLLRKFDEGERDRQRVEGSLQLTPLDTVSMTFSGDYRNDEYLGGRFGLRDAEAWSTGVDFSWTPVERVGFFGGYVHERMTQFMRSRQRPVRTIGGVATALDFTAFDWVSDIADTVDTIYAGVKFTLIPRVLDWSASANYAYALGRIDNRNPVDPSAAAAAGATAAEIAAARVNPFPAFEDTLIRVDTALRYHFLKTWTATLGYVFESFQKNDFRTDRLNPFQPGLNSIFMGNDSRNYAAHILGATLAYRFP